MTNFQRHENFDSQFIAPRHVDVWCPPGGYDGSSSYPVIYMHDGQNLFAPSLAYGGVDWGVVDAMTRLIENGKRGAIIVGIWNAGIRWREYMPQKSYDLFSSSVKGLLLQRAEGEPISDRYLKFVVEELKPFIDSTYKTMPAQENTFIMGSSMGGLISLYAISEYPNIFGGAGCVSTHWSAGGNELVDAMASALPNPAAHKLYFDFGTETLDAEYEPFQRNMDVYLRKAGYVENRNWLTLKFEGAEHSERSWRERVEIPLAFLLG